MKKFNKTKILILLIVIIIIITGISLLLSNINLNIRAQLFDLTENEPLKQNYIRNQENFINEIVPSMKITEEEYKNFLENPDNYEVYSLRCKINNKSNKELKAKYQMNKNSMWLDTITMTNTDNIIYANNETNKNINILVKVNGKNKKQIEDEINKISIQINFFEKSEKKIIKKVTVKFNS